MCSRRGTLHDRSGGGGEKLTLVVALAKFGPALVRARGKRLAVAATTSPHSPVHKVAALAKFGGADVRSE